MILLYQISYHPNETTTFIFTAINGYPATCVWHGRCAAHDGQLNQLWVACLKLRIFKINEKIGDEWLASISVGDGWASSFS